MIHRVAAGLQDTLGLAVSPAVMVSAELVVAGGKVPASTIAVVGGGVPDGGV